MRRSGNISMLEPAKKKKKNELESMNASSLFCRANVFFYIIVFCLCNTQYVHRLNVG